MPETELLDLGTLDAVVECAALHVDSLPPGALKDSWLDRVKRARGVVAILRKTPPEGRR